VRFRVVIASIVALGLGVGRGGGAAAGEADFHTKLRYRVTPSLHGCWDEAQFRKRVVERLDYEPFRDDAPVTVLVQISGSRGAISGHVQWKGQSGAAMGERQFVAKDGNCPKLLAEMIFAVVLEIELLRPKVNRTTSAGASAAPSAPANDASEPAHEPATASLPPPSASLPSSPPSPPPSAEPPATPPGPEPDAPRLAKDRPQDMEDEPTLPGQASQWQMWVGLGPSVAWRISPSATATARLFLGFRRGNLSLEIAGDGSYPSREQSWDGSGFRQMLITGAAAVCGHQGAFAGCLLAKAGEMRAQGLGLDQPRSPTAFVAQAGLRLGATVGLGENWLVSAHVDALGLLTPCTVELNGFPVWDMPWFGVLAGADLGARFW
jgi:hypothetical protein